MAIIKLHVTPFSKISFSEIYRGSQIKKLKVYKVESEKENSCW
jgi:hypothetical protein